MNTTHFGSREVPAGEKASLVREVFDRVAFRYDVMNDLMSFGLHRAWKKALIDQLRPRPGMRLLDLAGGTGDIAFRALAAEDTLEVTLTDINASMLREGRDRAINRNQLSGIEWICGNAENLPFPSRTFDACTIAFGIRNVTDIPQALKEIHRVLAIGGHFLCLEFSPVDAAPLSSIYDAFSFHVIPRMGRTVTGDAAPYQYLVESIRQFPSRERFVAMLKEAGFEKINITPLGGGVACIHSGWKL